MSRPLLDADYSAIEARITCWLAGQEDALEEYRQGVDRYKRMASYIFGIPEDAVQKMPHRFIGKQAILLCGFQGGPPKFRETCEKFGYRDMPEGLEFKAVEGFRAKHPKVKSYWYLVEAAAKRAIVEKGTIVTVRNVKFLCRDREGMLFLHIQLPSGRQLSYPKPRVQNSRRFKGNTEIVFFGHILGTKWGDVNTYGGKICENICQAVAADIMANGTRNAERAGYETATLIHDQCLSYYHPERGQTVEEFVRLLTTLPKWGDGLPLEAEGSLVPFYRKD
jgi:DNA polymerase